MVNDSLPAFAIGHPTFALAILVFVALAVGWRVKETVRARKYKLPPKIPGIPIFGNTFQLPPLKQGQWGIQMARKYGEMYVWATMLPDAY